MRRTSNAQIDRIHTSQEISVRASGVVLVQGWYLSGPLIWGSFKNDNMLCRNHKRIPRARVKDHVPTCL